MYEYGKDDGFATIAEEDRAAATQLGDSFLPKLPEPEAATSEPVRTYRWDRSTPNSDELYIIHLEAAGDGVDRLMGQKFVHTHGEDSLSMTNYQLFVDTGWFVVQREILTDEDLQMQHEADPASDQQEDHTNVSLELEAGLLQPDDDDWTNFMAMLHDGSEHHLQAEVAAGIAQLSDLLALEGSFEQ